MKKESKKLPNFVVQSGDLNWRGYAASEDSAFRKAFRSLTDEDQLSLLTRFRRIGGHYFYISTEAALDRAGFPKLKEK